MAQSLLVSYVVMKCCDIVVKVDLVMIVRSFYRVTDREADSKLPVKGDPSGLRPAEG